MRPLKTSFAAYALNFLTSLMAYAETTETSDECDISTSPYSVAARHIEPKGIGYDQGYTTVEGFFPLYNGWDDCVPFLDVRAHIFNNGKPAFNAGLGARYLTSQRIWGINSYYDYRNTKREHYNQIALGFESLGVTWDFRLNGYLPVGKKYSHLFDAHFSRFEGHSALLKAKYEYALAGVNAEAGAHVDRWKRFPLYFAAGPYYLTGKGGTAWGGQARASAHIFDCVKIDANLSYDHLFKWIGQGQIGLRFAFGSKKVIQQNRSCNRASTLAKRCYQSVDRFEIIPVDKKKIESAAINPATRLPYDFIFVDNTSSSLGTYESPYHALATAETNFSPYGIIYLFPGDGTTSHMDHGISLQANQKLWGSAAAHTLQTTEGLITIPQMSSQAPQVTNSTLLGHGATLSTHNEISGIVFTQTSGQAIFGADPITINISSCEFLGCGTGDLGLYPVTIQASSPLMVTVEHNNFADNQNAGVYVQLFPGASATYIAMNENEAHTNHVSSGGGAMMSVEAHGDVGTCSLVMIDNVFENNDCGAANITDFDSPHQGSFASFQGTFARNIFAGNGQGITFGTNAESCTLSILNNDLSGNLRGSILVTAGDDATSGTPLIRNATILIDSNQINQGGNAGDAITISPAGDTLALTIIRNSISDNLGTGFVSYFEQPGPNAILNISNNVIANNTNLVNFNASGGISFDGFNSVTAQITNNTFSDNSQGNTVGTLGGSFMTLPATSSVTFKDNQLNGNDTFNFVFYGNSPETGCLTISGNTSATDPTYIFQQLGSGSCFIVPCNYETVNTGGFNLSGVTPSTDCSGNVCPP